jgi:diadenosine tetraphosphate (Ap4A) HIT family hydrolase
MNCLFCSIPEMSNPHNPEDEIIDESEHFYAKAALGHFVYGYTLLISKEHLLSFAYLSEHLFSELQVFKDSVLGKLKQISSNPITILEHGAINRPQRAGACIDHAHLHLMPLPVDLYPILLERFRFAKLSSINEVSRFNHAQVSYLYYERQGNGSCGVELTQDVPSQLLRRIACQALGKPDLWDWRKMPLRESLQQFKNEYKRLSFSASTGSEQ